MTFDALWRIVCDKNPQVREGGNVTMPVASFCKAMKLAYQKGREQEAMISAPPDASRGDMPDFLRGLFNAGGPR